MALRDLMIHMPTVYGSSYEDMGKRVSDKYPNGTEQTKLQWAWGAWKARGGTADQFRNLWVTPAEALDGAWTYEAPNNLASGYQNTYTKVILPKGRFMMNAMVNIPRAGLIGESSFGYGGNGSDQGQVATEFVMDENWIGSGTERRMFQTPNADRTDNYAYNENCEIVGVRLTGPKKRNDGITRIGWYIKRAGSTTWFNLMQANGFNKGFVNVDGVPVVYGSIRAFENDIAGWSGEGTWGADMTIIKLECDGCGRAFQLIPSDQGAAGGTLKIGLKLEDGVTPGLDWPGMIGGWIEGQYCVDVFVNASYKNNIKPQQLFVVNPVANGNAQASLLTVQGKGFGYGKILKNNVTGSEWNGAGDYAAYRFEHYADGDGLFTNCKTITKVGGTTAPPVDPPVTPPSGTNIDRTNWVVTASISTAAHPPSAVKDGNTSTFWETGRPHQAGDFIQVDMGAQKDLSSLTILYQPYGNTWPNKLEVFTSLTGAQNSWTSRGVFSGSANCTVNFSKVNCRHFKVVTKELIPNVGSPWCSISDLTAKS